MSVPKPTPRPTPTPKPAPPAAPKLLQSSAGPQAPQAANPLPARQRLPAYALYGEQAHTSAHQALHCETIAARSRLHGWQIQPHRHARLVQLVWLASGRGQAWFDGQSCVLAGPALVLVPPLTAHAFRFAPSVHGLVFSVDERHWRGLLASADELAQALQQPRAWPLVRGDAGTRALRSAALALQAELLTGQRWRGPALDAALLRLLVAAARTLPALAAPRAAAPERALAHVQRYRTLVDLHFHHQPGLAELAAQLNITSTQLNRVCQQVLGRSALAVLHERLLLEAQRELAYTGTSVKQIAFALGFSDAAYFTRFFQRRAGHTPTAWRQAAQQPQQPQQQPQQPQQQQQAASAAPALQATKTTQTTQAKQAPQAAPRDQTRSSTSAMPWPTPMHIVHSA